MVRPISTLFAAVLLIAPGAASAQVAAAAGPDQVVNTAPSGPGAPPKTAPNGEVASVIDAAAEDEVDDGGPARDNRVHGEISVGAGTNGYREVSGAATVPLGDTGQASIEVDSEQSSHHR
ncbi:MAG TPA: hypothetical protein VE309_13490 [Caulobacteraceae bacterium]|jgi:hypothetical protein|nr:hypothetical protein [Caulobacteraceae bacterium]